MSEFVKIVVERRWTDDDSGDTLSYTDVERDFGAREIDRLHDEVLLAIVRELIGRTEVRD